MTLEPRDTEAVAVDPEGEHGEVFTRRWVVELILDLAGYTPDRDLAATVAVEPSCGAGAFLAPMVERLVASCETHGRGLASASSAIRAYDLLPSNVRLARERVVTQLTEAGMDRRQARAMAEAWVSSGDFLLSPHVEGSADFVLGNPPYVRLENLPAARNAAYRGVCRTMRGRSDIFVGFIEMGLRLLKPEGTLGYIVADRWMRNQYGSSLRSLIAESYSVEALVEMHDVDAFEDDVSAYPSVTVIRRRRQTDPLVASATRGFGAYDAAKLRRWSDADNNEPLVLPSLRASRLSRWFGGAESWPSDSPERLAILADLEARFPPLEDPSTNTRVGIGIATGADDVYLTRDATVVEPERLLPLVMARDLGEGSISWSGTYLINPWDEKGLIDFSEWPMFGEYVESHAERLKSRHTAMKAPMRWYRTIDRMTPGLLKQPKLLIPEMKASAHPVLDCGEFYPHHNLYHVTSERWDLQVLGGILLSDVANLFVGAYCVKMRGGTYRFQAQYLRKIRVPRIDAISRSQRRRLALAFENRDVEEATAVAAEVYGIEVRSLTLASRAEVA